MDIAARDPQAAERNQQEYEQNRQGSLAEGPTYSFAYQPLQLFSSPDESGKQLDRVDEILLQNAPTTPTQKLRTDFLRSALHDPNEATATVFMTRKQRHSDARSLAEARNSSSPENYITLLAMLSHPLSCGSVHIRSPNPEEKPLIDFKYLSHPLDQEVLAQHVLQLDKLMACEPLASCIKKGGKRLPKSFPEKPRTVEDAVKMIRKCAATNYHPVGTCAMMKQEIGGVVDERLVVYGTKNLRVCDASVFPILPRGNILSTVYAVAEMGADIIKRGLTQT